MLDDAEYKKEYDKAAAELEAAAKAITARGADGKFVKLEEVAKPAEAEKKPDPVVEEPKKEEPVDELAELRARVEKAEKIAKDNQAWATKLAQERAQERREREAAERAAAKPAILDANPELADAIRYVASDPTANTPKVDPQEEWRAVIEKAHPGIFDVSIDPDLEKAVMARFQSLGAEVQDPLVAIREITAEKLAHTERLIGKRFAAESAKSAEKSAMTVPGAGANGGAKAPPDPDLEAKNRILNMSPSEFEKERRKVLGI